MVSRPLQRFGFVSVAVTGLIVLTVAVSGVASIGDRLEAADRATGPAMSRVSLHETAPGSGTGCLGHGRDHHPRDPAPKV